MTPENGDTETPPSKRARTYARRTKRKTPTVNDINCVFDALRSVGPVQALVVSQPEYLKNMWEIYRTDFPNEYTFPVQNSLHAFESFIQTKK